MDYQSWIEGIDGQASLFSFDIDQEGNFGEILLMAVNKKSEGMLHMRPDAPEFHPGIPYREYWIDLNFESFVYKCASISEPLYSYVNARGIWLKGFYLSILQQWDEDPLEIPEGSRRVYCLYVVSFTEQAESEYMPKRSQEVANAVLDIGIKLHETKDFYKSMSGVVAQIDEICGAQNSALYIVDSNTHECCFINEDGINENFLNILSKEMNRTPYEVALAWEQDLLLSDCLILPDLKTIEERDPIWYQSMRQHGISNIILYIIRHNQNMVGFIWAANYDASRMDKIKETLELTTFLLAAVITNHQLLSRLEIKSNMDALTQVGNRNAMDEYIADALSGEIVLPKTMGVVFADLNGLKVINDEKGHDAGDKLLIRAASLLKIAFGDDQVYRIGGDEFVILCADTTKEKVDQQISQLKGMADNTPDVSFAVGSVFCEGTYDIANAISIADEHMYQDKKKHYGSN